MKWHKTKTPGVRYREHESRKHGIMPDRYYAIYYKVKGKRHDEPVGWNSQGWTLAKAAGLLANLKENHRKGEGPQTLAEMRAEEQDRRDKAAEEKALAEKEGVTFAEFFRNQYWPTASSYKKESSLVKEQGHFDNWINPVVGKLPLKDIRPIHLERIKKNLLDDGKSPRTAEYVFATFRQVWNQALRDGIVSGVSPSKHVKLPKKDNRRLRFLTHEEAELLLSELKKKSRQVHDMALLSLETGLRASEIFNLAWGAVELARGVVMVWDGKNKINSPVYLTDRAKQVFSGMKPGCSDELVFKNAKGRKIKAMSNTFRDVANELFNKNVMDPRQRVVFHSCRHSYASWLVQAGVPLYTVKELMRHETIAMTERYSHVGQNTLQDAVRQMEDHREKGDSKTEVLSLEEKRTS